MDTFKSRKFIFGMMLSLMGFALVLMGKFPVEQWAIFEATIGATYVIGNVGSEVAENLKK